MAGVLTAWKKYVPAQGRLLHAQLKRIVATDGLSDDVFEIANKSI